MKTLFSSSETSIFESAKRFIYSFQVLIVGIAIPFLFIIGISDGNQKKSKEPAITEATNVIQSSSNQVIPLTFARI